MDTTTSTGRLLFHAMACFAQFEREIIVERTMSGLRVARFQGILGEKPKGLSPDVFKSFLNIF
ncbi:MAG: recombinase family protein [Prevotellaceae bacterium]|nr:recombinase family protein [Prevotellaceae bacterium]